MKYSQQISLYLIDIDGFELMSFEEFWLILIKCDHPNANRAFVPFIAEGLL